VFAFRVHRFWLKLPRDFDYRPAFSVPSAGALHRFNRQSDTSSMSVPAALSEIDWATLSQIPGVVSCAVGARVARLSRSEVPVCTEAYYLSLKQPSSCSLSH
jgi:hypothetical protein